MKFTETEKSIINTLHERGAMGLTSLMPLIPNLVGKAQLKNMLEHLKDQGHVKHKQNGQWAVLKSTFAELDSQGVLAPAEATKTPPSKPRDDIPSLPQSSTTQQAKTAVSTQATNTAETVVDCSDLHSCDGERSAIEDDVQVVVVTVDDQHVETCSNKAEEVLFKLMQTIPTGATLKLDDQRICVDWDDKHFEPGLDQLASVLDAIGTLQQHAA